MPVRVIFRSGDKSQASSSGYCGRRKRMREASNCSHLCLYDIDGTQERSSQPSLTNLTLTLHATAPQPLLEPPKSTSENPGQGCDVGLEREKNIGTNNRWCQTWSYISIRKCEMHQTLVCIHWLTINARKGDFQVR